MCAKLHAPTVLLDIYIYNRLSCNFQRDFYSVPHLIYIHTILQFYRNQLVVVVLLQSYIILIDRYDDCLTIQLEAQFISFLLQNIFTQHCAQAIFSLRYYRVSFLVIIFFPAFSHLPFFLFLLLFFVRLSPISFRPKVKSTMFVRFQRLWSPTPNHSFFCLFSIISLLFRRGAHLKFPRTEKQTKIVEMERKLTDFNTGLKKRKVYS